MLTIVPEWFIRYKFFNSLFLGLSVGAIFTLYAPLEPSIYSLGGVFLALAMLLVARLYNHILNAKWFFRISLFVEVVLVFAILYFLYVPIQLPDCPTHVHRLSNDFCLWLLPHQSRNPVTQNRYATHQTRHSQTIGISSGHGDLLYFL